MDTKLRLRQAEISALENSGRLPASAYEGATMYTTLSPCDMCTGACILYKVKRVVIGENVNFMGGEDLLRARGKELVVLDNAECKQLMEQFIREKPGLWWVIPFLYIYSFLHEYELTAVGTKIFPSNNNPGNNPNKKHKFWVVYSVYIVRYQDVVRR